MTARATTTENPGRLAVFATRAWQGLRFRDALLISLIPLVGLGYLLTSSVQAYRRARAYQDYFSIGSTVASEFRARLHAAARLGGALDLRQAFDARTRDAGFIRLGVQGPAWDTVASLDQDTWDERVDGTLDYGGTSTPIQLRKRGDFSVHWLTEKRSLSVRTPKEELFRGVRTFGLSAKTPMDSYVANRLAPAFGLLVPATEIVPLFLNNRFYGIYRFVGAADESFLRLAGEAPGDILRGDRANRGDYYKGQQRSLFENPYLWDLAALGDRPGDAAAQLQRLVADINNTADDGRALMARFDRDEVARLLAYQLFVGDPYHADGVHNQLLYVDPSTGLLRPIPWDMRLLPLDGSRMTMGPVTRAWLRDPFVVDAVTRELAAAVNGTALPLADSLANAAERRYAEYFAYDQRREGLISDVGNAAAAVAVLRRNAATLRRWLDNDTVAYGVSAAAGGAVLDVEARGVVGADLVAVVADHPGALRLWRDANDNGVRDASDPEVPLHLQPSADEAIGTRYALTPAVPLLTGWDTDRPAIAAGHVPYRFFVAGLPAGARLSLELRNRATGRAAASVPWAAGAVIRPSSVSHPWRHVEPAHRATRLAGNVHLTGTLRIGAGDSLIIAPGTTLRLAPDVSIISRGLVLARGTAAQRIRVLGDGPGQPWGTVALLGSGADSSVLTYAEFAEGSGGIVDDIEYTGMVNVHRARGVLFDHVIFRNNARTDDTFHALHADVTVRNSVFMRAHGDAIDFDFSSGAITGDTIEASVHDGIDLNASSPWIADNYITDAHDRGIDAGAESAPVIFNNLITHSVKGIEVTDRSSPLIAHNEVSDNGIGLSGGLRNWRYGGSSWAVVALSSFERNGALYSDEFTRWTMWGTVGLDSLAEMQRGAAPPAADMVWLDDNLGVVPEDRGRAGRVRHGDRAVAVTPLDAQRFRDDFGAASDGWTVLAGTTRAEKRDEALVAEIERHTGAVARAVLWNLAGPAELVIQVGGRDIRDGRLVVTGDAGEVSTAFTVSQDPTLFRFVTLRLPAGRYREVRVEATPRPGLSHVVKRSTGLSVIRAGRLYLRGYDLYAAARP